MKTNQDRQSLRINLVDDTSETTLISHFGKSIPVDKTIRSDGRSTSGIKLLNLDADDNSHRRSYPQRSQEPAEEGYRVAVGFPHP